ncbi:MAG: hypothetical protein HEEMFOPI_01803 [Holosporales bacterium]
MLFRKIICLFFMSHSLILSSTPEEDFAERLKAFAYNPPPLPPMPQELVDMGLPAMPPLEEQEKRIYEMDEASYKEMIHRLDYDIIQFYKKVSHTEDTLFKQKDFDREKFYEEVFKFYWNLAVKYHFGPAYRQID